jgi:hypothetical protein
MVTALSVADGFGLWYSAITFNRSDAGTVRVWPFTGRDTVHAAAFVVLELVAANLGFRRSQSTGDGLADCIRVKVPTGRPELP